ncbi:Gfo/Idh/MocA family oxidoreductase [Campylobacter sp. faydin G-140]|uniref:Gfo/Idh/MocA family oxidoreductase n=1 Tax=Campylobacter anatolicus TaxID=2829105 RepID=UPI001BA09388|nr:Gfo/Idh/MocA family oxidoreductase [Campylobacter anatolicus]MBR8462102.1 Gfo/Idh/MocA family oxidoreductase [Campylobacter anatolicus]MBR8464812.1 Gfo/Idh/MocA family oxidoreductase [Campylobacter anatolicus]
MKLKIGIVGFNDIGKRHYSELRRSSVFEICGVFDKDGCDEFCRAECFTDFKNFIETAQPQAIVLCISANELSEAFIQSAKYCQNILIANPIFKDIGMLKEMKYIAITNKTRVCSGMKERFNPVIKSLQKALLRESEIYSINISEMLLKPDANITDEISLSNIDLAKTIINSEIADFSCMQTNRTNARSSDNSIINFKSKSQILVNITNSLSSQFRRFSIRVAAKNGIYFGDLINYRLYQLNENGQINFKIDTDQNEIKAQYDAFFDLCISGDSAELSTLDDAIKIKELFA